MRAIGRTRVAHGAAKTEWAHLRAACGWHSARPAAWLPESRTAIVAPCRLYNERCARRRLQAHSSSRTIVVEAPRAPAVNAPTPSFFYDGVREMHPVLQAHGSRGFQDADEAGDEMIRTCMR